MPVNRPSLVDGAERALRNWLAPGRYRQGDRLPPEHEVAAMLGVSRGTLRSALQRLEESGEIVRRQGSGTFVGRMAVPTAFGERLERLEPYSSVAARRGLHLSAVDLRDRAPGRRRRGRARRWAWSRRARATSVWRTLVAGGSPVAVMYDVVHPTHRAARDRRAAGGARAGQDGARRAHRHRGPGHLRAHARDAGAAHRARAGRQAAGHPTAPPPGSSWRSSSSPAATTGWPTRATCSPRVASR